MHLPRSARQQACFIPTQKHQWTWSQRQVVVASVPQGDRLDRSRQSQRHRGLRGSLRVRVDGSDNALAIWKQVDPSRGGIWTARFDAETSSWQTPENIERSASGNAEAPQIAMNNDGIAIAVWMLHDGERAHVWANRYAPDTGWGNARQLDEAKNGDASAPDVAIDIKGNAAAVWQQVEGTRSNIVASHFD